MIRAITGTKYRKYFLMFFNWGSEWINLPNTTTPTLSGSKLRAIPFSPELNSTISSAWMFLRPYTRAIPSPIDNTRPVSSRLAFGAEPRILSSKMEEISAEAAPACCVVLVLNWRLANTPRAAVCLLTYKVSKPI